jgi:tartronate-semialdehyde synthase
VNNAYLGLIRQAQRGFHGLRGAALPSRTSTADEGAGELRGYGVDHVAVAEAMGCKAVRVTRSREEFSRSLASEAQAAHEALHQVPVVLECILERVTNIAMGVEIDKINEFEAIDCRAPQGLETVGLLD